MGAEILATDLFAHTGFMDAHERESLINQILGPSLPRLPQLILTHDCVVIPTDDFLNIAVIAAKISPRRVSQLLDCGAIRFCRFERYLGFMPIRRDITNPGEFVEFTPQWKTTPRTIDVEEAASTVSRAILKYCGDTISASDIVKNTTIVNQIDPSMDVGRLIESVIRKSPQVQEWISNVSWFSKRMREVDYGRSIIALTSEREKWENDPWIRILLLYHAQMDLHLQNRLSVRDLSPSIDITLPYSISTDHKHPLGNSFQSIVDIASVPDIGPASIRDNLVFDRVIKLRKDRNSQHFRNWLGDVSSTADSADEIRREFVNMILTESAFSSLPLRAIRFLVTSAIDTAASLPIASVVDSFVLDRFIGTNRPRLFVEKLRRSFPAPKNK